MKEYITPDYSNEDIEIKGANEDGKVKFIDTGIFIKASPDTVIGSFNFGGEGCNICNRRMPKESIKGYICKACIETMRQIIYEYDHRDDPVDDFQTTNEEVKQCQE